jgi:hypothetical protein
MRSWSPPEKNTACRALESAELLRVERLGPVTDVELDEIRHPEVGEGLSVCLEVALRLVRGHGREDELAAAEPSGDFAQDSARALLVLAASNDDERSGAFARSMLAALRHDSSLILTQANRRSVHHAGLPRNGEMRAVVRPSELAASIDDDGPVRARHRTDERRRPPHPGPSG